MSGQDQRDKVQPMRPLDLALAHVTNSRRALISAGDIDLAIAWGQGRVTTSQASVGFGLPSTGMSVYSRLATAFREAIRTGRIKA